MSEVKFFVAVLDMAKKSDSLHKSTTSDRRILYDFMEVNKWFGTVPFERSITPMFTNDDFKKIKPKLMLWLSAYKKSGSDKVKIILNHFTDTYPITCRLYKEFIASKDIENETSVWQMLDFFFSKLNKEITDYSENDLEELVRLMDNETPLVIARMFAEFLKTVKQSNKPISNWIYAFEARDNTEIITEAYPLNNFAVMAYCTFNEEIWTKQDLVKKAVKSRLYADLWLFTALNFICALRLSDMK